MQPSWTRRQFLSQGVGAAAGLAGAQLVVPEVRADGRAPGSERVRLGLIGCGNRGQQLITAFKSFNDGELVATCDVNGQRLDQAQELLGNKPEKVKDYRTILDRKDVDAVIIATPMHWHGLPFIHACQAGKHVFVEKPLSHTVVEGRAMVQAAQKAGVITLMGTQQRGASHYPEAVELIQAGKLGKIAMVDTWNYSSVRIKKAFPKTPDEDPPAYLNWDQWIGPAPKVPYNRSRLRSMWYFDYNGGMMTDWGVHHFDIVLWAMKVEAPTRVMCSGGRFVVNDLTDTPDTIEAVWEFPSFLLRYTYRGTSDFPPVFPRPRGHGIAFYGTEATMVLDRSGFEIWPDNDPTKSTKKADGRHEKEEAFPWQRLFVDCVKGKRKPPLTIEDSHRSTVVSLLGNIAYHTRRAISWDPKSEQILGDKEAAGMLSRERRHGFELPTV